MFLGTPDVSGGSLGEHVLYETMHDVHRQPCYGTVRLLWPSSMCSGMLCHAHIMIS